MHSVMRRKDRPVVATQICFLRDQDDDDDAGVGDYYFCEFAS